MARAKKKPHFNTGNQHNVKDERGATDCFVQFRSRHEDKEDYRRAAEALEMTLTDWYQMALDNQLSKQNMLNLNDSPVQTKRKR